MTRVLIADDHTLVRKGLRLLLEETPGIRVVGEAADGQTALDCIELLHPDIVLMDITMPGLNGLDAVQRATKNFPKTRICILSMHANEAYVHQALGAGAAGYLLKGADRQELEHAIRTISAGGQFLSPEVASRMAQAVSPGDGQPLEVLTSRQREILQLLAEGESTKSIAARLGLSAKTVEAHRANLMARLGIRDIAGLVRFAIRNALVTEDR